MDIEQVRHVMLLVKDVTESLAQEVARNTQALANISSALVKVLEAMDSVPECEDIRKLLKEHIQDHESTVTGILSAHDKECASRTALATEREVRREADLLVEVKKVVEDATTPIKEMQDAYKKVLWLVGSVSAIGLTMFGYLKYVLDQVGTK